MDEWGDDAPFVDDEDLDEEIGLIARNPSSRPQTNVSTGSQLRSDSKRLRSKYLHQPVFGFSANKLKRDPIIESIIESRKSVIIENAYTALAQTTSQALRQPLNARINSLKLPLRISKAINQVHFNDKNNQIINSDNNKKLPLTPTLEFDNERWDDGLNGDFDKGLFEF